MSRRPVDKTSISMAATSSTTLIGFCAAIITLLITLLPQELKTGELVYALGFFVVALIFFTFSTEFYILAAWKEDRYETWGTIGSIVYGLGKGWLILGVSLTIHVTTPFTSLAYLVLITFLCGYIIYYFFLRLIIRTENSERFLKLRWIARGLILGQIIGGIFLLNLL